MIIISQPKLEVRENEVLVSSCIEDDKKHFRETIFYKTSAAYGPYAVTEKADLFVLSALMPALFSQSDIRVEGTLSSDLKYTLENGLIYILAKTYGVRPIKVHAERIETFEFGGKAVGAGCSMGVDSLATIKQHYIDDNRYGHKITHLAIFNTCEFGFEDANEANKLFRYEYSRAAAFARETGLELLYVQSNVTSLLNRYGTGLYDTCTLVHAAAILFLEKLYAVYYHSSGYLLDKLEPYLKVPIDAVVLGCTHYPFLRGAIRRIVGRRPEIIDGSFGIAKQLQRRLEEQKLLNPGPNAGSVSFQNSLDEPEMLELMQALFSYEDETP